TPFVHEYWLPPGITWRDMEQMEEYPRPRDLLFALPLINNCLCFLTTRVVAPSLGRYVGLRNRFHIEIVSLMAQCDKTQRQIETWFRHRRNQDRPILSFSFNHLYNHFFLNCLTFIFPLFPCPLQPIDRAHFWYYQLELGFYLSLLLLVSVDVKRKDFKEQVIHHIATIVLLGFSYCSNYVRIGTLVMLLHDSSDFLLESAKMFNYGTGWRKTCDTLFVIFAAVFLVTRLVVFPSKIIHTTLVLSMEVFEPFTGYYFFNVLLMVLQALHVFWAVLILRMAYRFLFLGKLDKDERSDEESEPEKGEDDKGDGEEEDEEVEGWAHCDGWNGINGRCQTHKHMETTCLTPFH
uniref:Ceramide synthase 4b n=1 Tax=Hucho hucho TaxID=62062 RepID=A0A4W5L8C0_9TELE